MPSTRDDPAYIAMGNLLYGSDQSEIPLTVRDPNGRVRDVTVTTGEQHIDAGAKALGISPKVLSFIDLLQVIFYPFLLWAAWLLHRRNSRDVVSSILSLAVLLSIGAEQPSTIVLAAIGVPRAVVVALFDLGNMLLLAGILLFPHGYLSWRKVALIACLPLLTFLQDPAYKAYLRRLHDHRRAGHDPVPSSHRIERATAADPLGTARDQRLCAAALPLDRRRLSQMVDRQLRPAVAGRNGRPASASRSPRCSSSSGSSSPCCATASTTRRSSIGRSVNFAVITLGVAAVFAAAGDALKQIVYNYSGNTSNEGPIIFAAALATIMVNPIQERVQRWSEKRFQKHLFLLRNDLPQSVRDLRETASLDEMVGEILAQVDRGVRAVRSAMIVNGCVLTVRGMTAATRSRTGEPRSSRRTTRATSAKRRIAIFPIRVPLVPSSDQEEPIGYLLVGPRPDGSIASRDEQKALAEVSEEIARAIRTVIKREARELEVTESDRRQYAPDRSARSDSPVAGARRARVHAARLESPQNSSLEFIDPIQIKE